MPSSSPHRKKSPRAPSISLEEAIERVQRVYEKEKRHAAPTEVVVQNMGYKSANNGAALAALASVRYYGLLEKPQEGKLAVTKEFESYLYAPDVAVKHAFLLKWLRSPQVFADLIERYPGGFPSDKNLRFDLMDRGFSPTSADSVVTVFQRSVEFVGLSDTSSAMPEILAAKPLAESTAPSIHVARPPAEIAAPIVENQSEGDDKIPIRLTGGRRAWLIVPSPFFEADKARLKAQIDLLLTEDTEPRLG